MTVSPSSSSIISIQTLNDTKPVEFMKCCFVYYKEGRISECVKDRIQAGNKAYAANYHMLKSKIIKRSVKIQIYKTVVRPVATYGSETLTLTKLDENSLMNSRPIL